MNPCECGSDAALTRGASGVASAPNESPVNQSKQKFETPNRKNMKSLIKNITLCALLNAMIGIADAQTTNLVPNGDFAAGGPTADWVQVSGGGSFVYTYPDTGGNPATNGVIDNTGGGGWGIWVGGDATPLTLTSLGLTAGATYTFKVDMKILSGAPQTNLGGFKVDFFTGVAGAGSTGDMRPSPAGHNTAAWETYNYSVTIPGSADGVKLVPLWGPNSSVAYDNIRVVVPASSPLAASITSPVNLAQVGANFTISANASVLPGAVTNVNFYVDNVLNGNDDTAPYTSAVIGALAGTHALKVVAQGTNGIGAFISVTSSVVNVTVVTAVTLYVDPTKPWQGYMNVFAVSGPGYGSAGAAGFIFGSPWGIGDLCAAWSGSQLTLSPNKIGDPDPFWYVTTNSPSVGNKIMDASMYVEPSGSLPGLTVTFTGTCITNTLAIDGKTNTVGNGWTCVAFIKDFAPDFSSFNISSTTLTNGMPFSISLATISDPARHVQYGFETIGPDVWFADPVLPSYGKVQVGPLTATAVSITPSSSGSTFNMSFPTQTGFAYTVQYKTNLTDVSWSTLTVTNGTGATAVVTTSANQANRFYRVSIQ